MVQNDQKFRDIEFHKRIRIIIIEYEIIQKKENCFSKMNK